MRVVSPTSKLPPKAPPSRLLAARLSGVLRRAALLGAALGGLSPLQVMGASCDLSLAKIAGWREYAGKYYRLAAQEVVHCFSHDGLTCSEDIPDPSKVDTTRSVACRAVDHERADHWCSEVYANLFAKWTNYRPLGHDALLAVNPAGLMMCYSENGTGCRWNDSRERPPADVVIRPVQCGADSRRLFGTSGHEAETPGHWCKLPRIVADLPPALPDTSGSELHFSYPLPDWVREDQPLWVLDQDLPPGATITVTSRVSPRDDPLLLMRASSLRHPGTGGSFYVEAGSDAQSQEKWPFILHGKALSAHRAEIAVPAWPFLAWWPNPVTSSTGTSAFELRPSHITVGRQLSFEIRLPLAATQRPPRLLMALPRRVISD